VTSAEIQVVIDREVALLTSEVRRSPEQLETLLAPDFVEIGASGRLWSRAEIIRALVAETRPDHPAADVREIEGRYVAEDLVLLTFVTDSPSRRVRRCSLWRRTTGGQWQIAYHQGTPVP
jgi:hypothetical protein